MTGASEGLRKALVRGQKGSVLTLPEMSAEELLAQMTDDQRTALAASLNPAANAGDMPKKASDDEDEDDMETEDDGTKKPKSKKKDDEYMDDKAAAAKAATDRSLAVMASDHFAGREKLAATLLASSMSADEIITALAAAPKGPASGVDADDADDAKARADMRAKLSADQPGELGDDDTPDAGAFTDWASIHAEVAKDRGYATN